MKKKRKFKPFQVFCAVENETVCDIFRSFAAKTHAGFNVPKRSDLFEEITKSGAYVFFLDWSSYQSVREQLDERYGNEDLKPLIYLVGELLFYSPINISDWIHIFGREDKEDALRDIIVARSRKRS